MEEFEVGDKVRILSDNCFETVIEEITEKPITKKYEGIVKLYWSRNTRGELLYAEAYEMEHVGRQLSHKE